MSVPRVQTTLIIVAKRIIGQGSLESASKVLLSPGLVLVLLGEIAAVTLIVVVGDKIEIRIVITQ